MPKRHNSFQDAVAHVQRFLATDDVNVEEGLELVDRITGDKREVDVVLRAKIAGQPVTVCVEAFESSRTASVTKVEQLIAKHANLETSQLVLVCDAGFSKAAKRTAASKNVTLIVPDELHRESGPPRLAALESIWPKTLEFTVTGATIHVLQPDGVKWFRTLPDVMLYDAKGTETMHAITAALGIVQAMGVPEEIGEVMRDVVDQRVGRVIIDVDPFEPLIAGRPTPLSCRWEESDPHRLDPVVRFTVTADYVIVAEPEARLSTTAISGVQVTYGETTLSGSAVRIFDIVGNGKTRAVMRIREGGGGFRDVDLAGFHAPDA